MAAGIDKGSEREIYTACKNRNKDSIQRIRDLGKCVWLSQVSGYLLIATHNRAESQIARLELEIQEKKQRTSCLHTYGRKCTQFIERKRVYNDVLERIAENDRIDWIELQQQRKQDESVSGHSVESLCRILERILLGSTDAAKDDICRDIERTIRQENPKLVLSCITRMIREQRLDQERLQVDDTIWKEKLQKVEHKYLARDIAQRREERSTLARHATQAQLQLKAKVRQLYPDIEVQQAVL